MSKKFTTEEFIEKARKVHGDKYDYSKVEYIDSVTKVNIICPLHGEFMQAPTEHLRGRECKECAKIKGAKAHTKNTEQFVNQSIQIHGHKYDYSKVKYKNVETEVCIICPKHGEFWQIPHNHLSGCGCKKCRTEKIIQSRLSNTEDFIVKANKIHNKRYDYSKVCYTYSNKKVCIICHLHGEFWQTPNTHLRGNGCPFCNVSHLENSVKVLLESNNISFESQKRFEWLGLQALDFYIPSKNIAIECQGIQHFEVTKHFGGEKKFFETQNRDQNKLSLCQKHNIKLLYYADYKYDFPYEVITDKDELLMRIKE